MTGPSVILVADDYAMTEGISEAIERLASARRLSAASAMTTSGHWPAHAPRIARLRGQLAIGLHLDLTLLGPLAPMPRLAPAGKLPHIGEITKRALFRDLDPAEIAAETERQLDAFEEHLGFPPDHLDGHQHVHALPVIRDAVLSVLQQRYAGRPLLVRDPADSIANVRARRRHATKAMLLSGLSRGFGRAVRASGFLTNDSFAGVSDFATGGALPDFEAAAIAPGHRHLVMCHPGIPDAELARIDPVTARRREELDLLMDAARTPFRVWTPDRPAGGPAIDWGTITTLPSHGSAA